MKTLAELAMLAIVALMPLQLAQAEPYDGALPRPAPEVVETGVDRHDRMTVPVTIEGSGPFRFIIDTGAERTVLSRDVATQLGLPLGEKALLMGVAGTQLVDTVELNDVGMGSQTYSGLIAPLLEGQHIGADGIVGVDSLQNQRILFDFARERLEIEPAGHNLSTAGYEILVTARRKSGQLILTEAFVDGIRVDVVIDTGAQTSIGNRELQRRLTQRGGSGQTVLRSVTGQEITTDIGVLRNVVVDRLVFEVMGVVFADAPPFERLGLDKRPAILLGMSNLRLFNRVLIDFPRRRVLFDLP